MGAYGSGGAFGSGPGIIKKVGTWVPTIAGSTVFGGGAAAPAAPNSIVFSPFVPGFNFSADLMWLWVNIAGAAGTKFDVGIYGSGTDGLPQTLLSSVLNIPADVIGSVQSPISVSFAKGAIYWIASVTNGGANLFGTFDGADIAITNPNANAGNQVLSNAHAYGTMPTPWPYGAGTGYLSGAPLYKFRVSG